MTLVPLYMAGINSHHHHHLKRTTMINFQIFCDFRALLRGTIKVAI
jgi:hypothetical protein